MGKISPETDPRIRAAANDQCGYCRLPQRIHASRLEIEHIWPKAEGGTDDEENLWLACRDCNLFKSSKTHAADPDTGEKVRLFNPRNDSWYEHFEFAGGSVLIIGKTSVGRATVESLSLNNMHVVTVRREWAKVGWYPPEN